MYKYLLNSTILVVAFLALFIGISAIAVALGSSSWNEVTDWSAKASLVALVVIALNAVITGVTRFIKK